MDERQILGTELRWSVVVAAAVGLIIAVVVVSSLSMASHPPSNVETLDPTTLHLQGEFIEENLGTVESPDGSVTVRIIATQFAFVPRCIAVPAGREVTLRATSPDVIHGFLVNGTNANTMVVPGYVSELTTTFDVVGDHLMPCHEYCGLGHSYMSATVRVLAEEDWNPDDSGRIGC